MALTAEEYNAREILAGRVTAKHLAGLVDAEELVVAIKVYQRQNRLVADGKLGAQTRQSLETTPKAPGVFDWTWHLYQLEDGRLPRFSANTSGLGVVHDAFYPWLDTDPDPGDGVMRGELRKHFFPAQPTKYRSTLAMAAGTVIIARPGGRRWVGDGVNIDHGGSLNTIYLHLRDLQVEVGERVAAGQVLATDLWPMKPPHPHVELHHRGRVQDPMAKLAHARYLTAP